MARVTRRVLIVSVSVATGDASDGAGSQRLHGGLASRLQNAPLDSRGLPVDGIEVATAASVRSGQQVGVTIARVGMVGRPEASAAAPGR